MFSEPSIKLLSQELVCSKNKQSSANWNAITERLYLLNIGMEEALHYLYSSNPTVNELERWITEKSNVKSVVVEEKNLVLDKDDLIFFESNGYVVVKNVVSKEDCMEAQAAIWEFLGASINNPKGWYGAHPGKKGLMLTFCRHAALDKIRNSGRIKKAYEQLYKTTALYKTIDKVSFNPPQTDSFKFNGEGQHLDVSLSEDIAFILQGLVYLSDCGHNDGAFKCVPGFHNQINNWMKENSNHPDIRGLVKHIEGAITVSAQAGDAIIWHQGLPHCASANKGQVPRMVQYITYKPLGYKEPQNWR